MDKEMTNVFVVTVAGWDTNEVMGVFSTREKAEAYVNSLDKTARINSEIIEFKVA